ncbi:MAG TPA: glycosyltransferase [Thermoanaerobaculia bacterium]|nr:glycosyltransferase [Thermoanaerobaculia bacterium]
MRIAQIILPTASEYEKKSQRADFAALAGQHEVVVIAPEDAAVSGAHVAHVFATGELPRASFRKFPLPYVSAADIRQSRWPFGRAVAPDYVVSPVLEKVEQSRFQPLPEVVEDAYFEARASLAGRNVIGSFARESARNMVEQTLARIHRFRDDVSWRVFDRTPAPDDLASVDVWADPAVDDLDFDGFVAEALVVGLPVVAARTPINLLRLERGRTGFLVPPRDPNEMTHAILAALFKREAYEGRVSAARQTVSKFRSRQRIRVLAHMYETLIS